jgi:hypothetical protein
MPGLRGVAPACDREAGNDGVRLGGTGCSAADLCAVDWHVCQTKIEVEDHLPLASRSCAGLGAAADMFFATAQDGAGGNCSDPAPTNDFSGCGTYGAIAPDCLPLDRTTNNMCVAFGVGGWNCPDDLDEVSTVTKSEPLIGGGVLCCKEP